MLYTAKASIGYGYIVEDSEFPQYPERDASEQEEHDFEDWRDELYDNDFLYMLNADDETCFFGIPFGQTNQYLKMKNNPTLSVPPEWDEKVKNAFRYFFPELADKKTPAIYLFRQFF